MNPVVLTPLLTAMAMLSVITFLLSLLYIPWFIRRLPDDYFLQLDATPSSCCSTGQILRFLLKNILGCLLLVAGIAMLFLPGQGIITIVLALLLLSFPGKPRLIRALVRREQIRKSLNWMRMKGKQKPFIWPD